MPPSHVPTLGVLMLDTRFPRLPGDIGNPASVDMKTLYHTVAGADVARVVTCAEVDPVLLGPFVDGARDLERRGATLMTTSCGFLSVFQNDLAAAVDVPVIASSLLLVPVLARMLAPGRPVGIVTANSETLSPVHLAAAGIASPVVICGIEGGRELPRALLQPKARQATTIDPEAATRDVIAACRRMLGANPGIGAIVFECTNLQPYADAVRDRFGLPVFGLVDAIRLFHPHAVPGVKNPGPAR